MVEKWLHLHIYFIQSIVTVEGYRTYIPSVQVVIDVAMGMVVVLVIKGQSVMSRMEVIVVVNVTVVVVVAVTPPNGVGEMLIIIFLMYLTY